MRRTTFAGAILGATVAFLGAPGAALAGGGCHGGATQQDATGSDGATVRMVDACFTASITSVDPGTDVTFVNDDEGVAHNVGGTLWGHLEDLYVGDTYTATFDEPGIYPFACSYHPGMTGAIVVGDGEGAGNGLAVSTTPPKLDPASTGTTAESDPASATPWVVAAAVGGVAVGAGAALAAARTRKALRAA